MKPIFVLSIVMATNFGKAVARQRLKTLAPQLKSMRTDVVNQIRGMLRTFGILIKGIAGVSFENRI